MKWDPNRWFFGSYRLEIWWMTLKFCPVWPWNLTDHRTLKYNRARKAQIRVKFLLSSLTLAFDLWLWLFAWTSLLSMIITPENLMMIRWQKQWKKCDRRTYWWMDRWTEPFIELPGHSRKNTKKPRDLIAVTGLVILLKLDSNQQFFCPYDLEI